jgi:hypothetical protein
MRIMLIAVVMLLLVSTSASAIKIFPTLTELGENYDVEQSFILTVLNDGPKAEEITLTIDPESYYLADFVTIEPDRFTLKSNSKKNIQITTSFPKNLSPEKHRLIIQPFTDDDEGERTVYSFKVPGIARPDLRIEAISGELDGGSLIFSVMLNNMGNVIGRASPRLSISNGSAEADSMQYESRIMVMPYQKENLTLLYDTSDLPAGDYKATLVFDYNDNLKTNEDSLEFNIDTRSNRSSGGVLSFFNAFKYPLFIIIIIILLVFSIKPEYLKMLRPESVPSDYPKETIARLNRTETRIRDLEQQTKTLVKETQDFIRHSNDWLDQRFGKGTYEFK